MVPKSQITFRKDLDNTLSHIEEYGWRNTGNVFKAHILPYLVDFCKEVIEDSTTEDGKVVKITYGIERIPDVMAMVEMQQFREGLNVDRLIALGSLIAFAKVQEANRGIRKRIDTPDKKHLEKSENLYKFTNSPFRHIGMGQSSPPLRKVRALACVPLGVENRPMGCLVVGRELPIQPEELRLLTAVSEMAANAIHRAGLMETLEARVADRTRDLKAANLRLRVLDSLKSEFVTNVSHELRTPITNILLYLDLVDQPVDDQRRSVYISSLKRESERLGRLIDDLITLSRIERGVLPLDFQPHALDPLIAEVIATHEARARAKGIRLTHELNPTLPVVLVSREQISQAFTNLVGNAIAYTPPGGEVAMCSETWLEDGRAQVAVRVSNEEV